MELNISIQHTETKFSRQLGLIWTRNFPEIEIEAGDTTTLAIGDMIPNE